MISEDDLKGDLKINFAPMVDFLFLTVTVFAVLAVSRTSLFDSKVELANLQEPGRASLHSSREYTINLSVSEEGKYKLITDAAHYIIEDMELLKRELNRHYLEGALPADKKLTHVLLHIDKKAQWEAVANLIFSIKELGFTTYPVYQSE